MTIAMCSASRPLPVHEDMRRSPHTTHILPPHMGFNQEYFKMHEAFLTWTRADLSLALFCRNELIELIDLNAGLALNR